MPRSAVPRLAARIAVALCALSLVAPGGRPALWAASERLLASAVTQPASPAASGEVTFVVGGDNRPTGKGAPLPRVAGAIFEEIGLLAPDFVLWSGDTVYGYCDTRAELEAEYDAFFAVAARGGVPLYNAPGNHEIHSGQSCPGTATDALCGPPCSEEVFEKRFGRLYGSFDYGGLHFIALDTDVPGHPDEISGAQLEWLKKDLEDNRKARAIFLFCHTEFYSSPKIDPPAGLSHPAVFDRIALHELFRRYPVRAVFAGHEHLYWREPAENHDGIEYFVVGGGGAPLYASPDRGGFSHYVLVRVGADNRIGYDVIEPGRLYVEPAVGGAGGTAAEARLWIVNSNDVGNLTLGGIRAEVPASLGACADLTASSELKKRDGSVVAVPLKIVSCNPGTPEKPAHQLRLRAEGVPAGTSLPVVIRRKY
jgi:calcineurin-like phosphoesterase family protein